MKTQVNYYQVFVECCGIYKQVKQFRSKKWLDKYIAAHPNVLFYRSFGERYAFDYNISKGRVTNQYSL